MAFRSTLVQALFVALLWGPFGNDTLAAGEAAQSREGLVLEYRFEGNAADTSGNRHDGRINGNPEFVHGRVGQCIVLDGQQDYIDSSTSLADLGQTFTVECWVNPADRQNLHADIFGNHNHGGFGFAVEQDGDHTNCFAGAYGAGSGQWIGTRPVALVAGRWQHIALVKTPVDLRLCLNGIPVATIRNGAAMLPSPLTVRVGGSLGDINRCFRGRIDEFRVWKKAITEFHTDISPDEKLELFAQATRVRLLPAGAVETGPAAKKRWTFVLDEMIVPCVPPEVEAITLQVEAEDWRTGSVQELPPIRLERSSRFNAEVCPSLNSGYYLVRCIPTTIAGNRRIAGKSEEFYCAFHTLLPASSRGVPRVTPPVPGDGQPPRVIPLDGEGWLIDTDPKNEGRRLKWYEAPTKGAKATRVPWVIQDVFPDYHGVAWYWRDFTIPAHHMPGGRYLLKFRAVDYLADVWVNGVHLGCHEGGETPFLLDATQAVKPCQTNRLTVRVLNPTYEPIDGIALKQTPSGAKQYPVAVNAVYNIGGIVDSVEMLLVPAVWIEDLHVIPDWKTGEIRVRVTVRNDAAQSTEGIVQLAAAPAVGGNASATQGLVHTFPPGEAMVDHCLHVENHRLWRLDDPHLYRVTARVLATGSPAFDEQSVRCGFRDFRFENGTFCLNGARIFLHGSINVAHFPVGYTWSPDPDMIRREVIHMKTVGINLCRFSFGGSLPRQLDVFDELGVMVCMEHYASWQLQDSPQMTRRFYRSLGEIILRDRNHPSVVAWGILNETGAVDPAFRLGVESLPLVRHLDASRMCILNSGRFDGDYSIGSVSNPGSQVWESDLRDVHGYPSVPLRAETLRAMREGATPDGLWTETAGGTRYPVFVSEYGHCGAVDLPRVLGYYDQWGKPDNEEARYYRRQMEKFMADWQTWRLVDVWPRPEDFFAESHADLAKLRRIGQNALRANPHLVGFSGTYPIADSSFCGSGVANAFRELKPGLVDAVCELTAPLRWCLFAEPVHVYRGDRVRLEAVLANEDVLRAGTYPVRFEIVGPKMTRVWTKTLNVEIPQRSAKQEPPFAQPVYTEEVRVDGPAGRYRFLATLLRGGAPRDGEAEFYVGDPAEMPKVKTETVLWGDDTELRQWLAARGIRSREFNPGCQEAREVILACGKPPAPGGAVVFSELARHIARGSTAVFIDPSVFSDGKSLTRWLPLRRKGVLSTIDWVGGYYRADMWAKNHPIFEGLSAGGIMDPTYYQEILPQRVLLKCYTVGRGFTQEELTAEFDEPVEAISGANRLSANYASGLLVAVYRLGAGRFVLNMLLVRENLGRVPAAERLLRNMLNYAARETDKPPVELPTDFEAQLEAMGYER
jgi:hypothetical protein